MHICCRGESHPRVPFPRDGLRPDHQSRCGSILGVDPTPEAYTRVGRHDRRARPWDHYASGLHQTLDRCPAVVSFAFSIHQSSKRALPSNVRHPHCIPHLPHRRAPTTTLDPALTAAHQRYILVSIARLPQFTLSYLLSNDSSSLAPPPTIYAYGSILSPPRSSRHIRTSTILDEPPHMPINISHDPSCYPIRQDASLVSRT